VPAGSLIALRKHQPGVVSVTNPVRGSGGADAETIEALRARAPRRLRHFDRIVTADDYRAAAIEAAGVKGALVDLVKGRGGSTLVCVTLDTEAAASSHEAASVRRALAASIEARRAAQLDLRVLPPRRAPFAVTLAVQLTPGADRPRAEEAVRAALLHAFGHAHAAIGTTIDPDRVAEVVIGVAEVTAASILALHRHGHRPLGIAPLVPARASRDSDDGRLHGAELLVIDGVEIAARA
jgi:predicted phage baseplate assembly protein